MVKRIIDLLPCPFCGGEAEPFNPFDIDGTWTVLCSECASSVGFEHTEAEAIEAWNTRHERTCEQEERGWGTEGDHARVWLTCGHDCMVPTVQDLPNYCPNCGSKVVGV